MIALTNATVFKRDIISIVYIEAMPTKQLPIACGNVQRATIRSNKIAQQEDIATK